MLKHSKLSVATFVGLAVLVVGEILIYFLYLAIVFPTHFEVAYTGALKGDFKGRGQIMCGRLNNSSWFLYIQLSEHKGRESIFLNLPSDITLGTHAFSSSGALGETYSITGRLYQQNKQLSFGASDVVAGDITIDTFPKATNDLIPNLAAQSLKGRFEATIRTTSAQEYELVYIQGHFDFTPSSECLNNECVYSKHEQTT